MEYDVDVETPMACEDARLKCAYRVGCGMALQNYLVGCSSVLQGPYVDYCPEVCLYSLIALTSTQEGQKLMNCQCNEEYCRDQKRRVEICRPQVIRANRKETVVSCRVAQWICAADSQCSTALGYYNHFCRSMFHGKKCTKKCKNSISILRRQEQAAKLATCKCDGREDFDCNRIQQNMARLCFDDKETHHPDDREEEKNELEKESEKSQASSTFSVFNVLLLVTSLLAVT